MKKKEWKKEILKACKEANTYQPYFEAVIDTLAQILEQRDIVHDEFVAGGSKATVIRHTERSGEENIAKNPLILMEADLNSQALAYWRDLGLTPKGLRTLTADVIERNNSVGLDKLLAKLDG